MHRSALLALLLLLPFTGWAQYLDWIKTANAGMATDSCLSNSIFSDRAGNTINTGKFIGTVDFDPGPGVLNFTSYALNGYIQKLDTKGNLIWAKQFSGSGYNTPNSVATDSFDNIYVVGWFDGSVDFDPGPATYSLSAIGLYDIFIVKLDPAGNFIWAKQIGGIGNNSLGGSVVVDHAGNVYMGGAFSGTVDFDPGIGVHNLMATPAATAYNSFIEKLDSGGNLIWVENVAAGLGVGGFSSGGGLTLDHGGHIYLIGEIQDTCNFNPAGYYPVWEHSATALGSTFITKLDTAGHFIWAKVIGGSAGSGCEPSTLKVDVNGSLLLTGWFVNNTDLDPGPGVHTITSLSTTGFLNGFVEKLTSSGNFIWGYMLGSADLCVGYGLCTDEAANVYVSGAFTKTVDFDPGAGVYALTAGPTPNTFIQKTDSNGNLIYALQTLVSGATSLYARGSAGMAIDSQRNLYIAGTFNGSYEFDTVGGNTTIISSSGFGNQFVEKLFQFKYTYDTIEACKTYTLGTATYSVSGVYTDTFTALHGIDSMVFVSLTVDTGKLNAGTITCADTVCVGSSVALSDVAAGGVWMVANAKATVSAGSVPGVSSGSDSVYYVTTNICGNDTATKKIYVEVCANEATTPGALPHGLRIAPNPSNGSFSVSFSSLAHKDVIATITDMTGQKLAKYTICSEKENPVQLKAPPGVYLFTVTGFDAIYTNKIVISN